MNRTLCALALFSVATIGAAQTSWSGNGHYYELVTSPLNWNAAKAAAAARTFMGVNGHLLTINSQGEQDFIVATFGSPLREKHIGGELVNDQWTWVTGEPFTYTNWAPGEPNGGLTGCVNFHGANALGTWNDIPTFETLGYFVEYSSPMDYITNKTHVAGQNSVKGTVRIPNPATSAVTITLSDDSVLVSEPPTATIAVGQTEKSFQIQTMAVNSTIVTQLRAQWGVIQRNVPLTLIPLVPTAMAFTPNPVVGGNNTSCRLVINGVAGPGGRVISIFDNNAFSVVPNQVTVPPGATQVIFDIQTLPVVTQQYVTVTAAVSAGSKTGNFRIIPGG